MDRYYNEHQVQTGRSGSQGFGTHLKSERQNRGITLEELSDATKIRVAYLEALESEDMERLPAPPFTKGFIRSYCRYVRIDGEQVVRIYSDKVGTDERHALDVSTFRPKSRGEKMSRFMESLKRVLTGSDAPIFR